MEPKESGSKGLIFVWIYLVCVGFSWLLGSTNHVMLERDASISIYQTGVSMLSQADTAIATYKFDNDEVKAQYYARYEEFKSYLSNLKRNDIDRLPWKGLLIGLVAFCTALAYILAGVKIFKRSLTAIKFLKWGIGGFFMHYLLLVVLDLSTLLPLNRRIVNIFLVFEPHARYSLFEGWIVPMTAAGVLFMAIGYTFYVLLPRVFLSRPGIKAQLR